MSDDVVGGTKAVEVRSQIPIVVEDDRVLGIDVEKVLQVEDLKSVVVSLGANVDVVFDDLHVSPADDASVCVQSAKVCEFAVLADFHECNTIGVANNTELAAFLRSPSPDVVAPFSGGAQVFVRNEVQKVDILARVLASKAVLALCGGCSLLVLLVTIEGTACSSLLPRLQLELHHVLHSCSSRHSSGAEQASSKSSGELHDSIYS